MLLLLATYRVAVWSSNLIVRTVDWQNTAWQNDEANTDSSLHLDFLLLEVTKLCTSFVVIG